MTTRPKRISFSCLYNEWCCHDKPIFIVFSLSFIYRFWNVWEWITCCRTCQPCTGIIGAFQQDQPSYSTSKRHQADRSTMVFTFTGYEIPRKRTSSNNYCFNNSSNTLTTCPVNKGSAMVPSELIAECRTVPPPPMPVPRWIDR